MNEKTKKMGLTSTNFVTPHGLDENNHYTTAHELALITDYALENKKIAQTVSMKNYNISINGKTKNISNTNELLGYLEGVNGVKTGYTSKAGRCLVTSTNREGLEIITVVLGANTKKIRTGDSIKLIEYAYKEYELVNLADMIEVEFNNWKMVNLGRININKGKTQHVKLAIDSSLYKQYVVKKSNINNIWFDINCKYNLEAPILKNDAIGNVKVNINNNKIIDIKIIIQAEVKRKSIADYIYELLNYRPINPPSVLTDCHLP